MRWRATANGASPPEWTSTSPSRFRSAKSIAFWPGSDLRRRITHVPSAMRSGPMRTADRVVSAIPHCRPRGTRTPRPTEGFGLRNRNGCARLRQSETCNQENGEYGESRITQRNGATEKPVGVVRFFSVPSFLCVIPFSPFSPFSQKRQEWDCEETRVVVIGRSLDGGGASD